MKTNNPPLFSLSCIRTKGRLERFVVKALFACLLVFVSSHIFYNVPLEKAQASEIDNISDVTVASVSDITVPATSGSGANVTFTVPLATEYDSVTATTTPAPVSCSPASGDLFPVGITSVVCVGQGQVNPVSGTTTFQVTVQPFSSPSDTTAPVITITGSSTISLSVGDPYVDQGATALDDTDGDITANIQATSTVDTATAGSYSVVYAVTDAAGNAASSTRSVIVSASASVA